jgi:DNA sulfur modification protein DndC
VGLKIKGMDLQQKLRAIRSQIRDQYRFQPPMPWIIGFSGGKDSTLLAQLVVEAILGIAPEERTRQVYLVCNDTLVESPLFQRYVVASLDKLREGLETLSIPLSVVTTKPKESETFWVNMLGRGYPAPNRSFRWCTDRMKVRPTSEFIKSCVSQTGEVVLLLGVRRNESAERAKNIQRREVAAQGSLLKPHDDLKGCQIYCPIQELTTDDVWVALLENRPPWGGKHSDLFQLYRDASDGECPFVLGDADVASCGSSSARFGCWTCTVVEKDRSLEALAGAGYTDLQPLVDFRTRLKSVSENPEYRSKTRRNGQPGLGPLTVEARELLLAELLAIQEQCGLKLISDGEERLVREQWVKDEYTSLVRGMSFA